MIAVDHLTQQYPNGKGIKDVSFQVLDGEIMGYLGPNGSGKTTTIRCLLGFSKADHGGCTINGFDCRRQAPAIQKFLGYIPGEIAFLDGMSGEQFLNFLANLRGTRDKTRMYELVDRFEINLSGKIKKYSKGMKQKVGIIAAFMHDPQVIILDEPTSGLDPLMQNRFIDLVLQEKKRGKTILMSSHIFEEVERCCDRLVIIKEGCIVKQADMHELKQNQCKVFSLQLDHPQGIQLLQAAGYEIGPFIDGKVEVYLKAEQVDSFIKLLSTMKIISLESREQNLEDIFLNLYGREEEFHEGSIV